MDFVSTVMDERVSNAGFDLTVATGATVGSGVAAAKVGGWAGVLLGVVSVGFAIATVQRAGALAKAIRERSVVESNTPVAAPVAAVATAEPALSMGAVNATVTPSRFDPSIRLMNLR
jgi:hypothetical protein